MKIAVYHDLPSGGAKRTLFEQVKRLASRHEIDVFTLGCADHDFCDLRPWAHHHRVFPFAPLPLFRSPFGRANQLQRWRDLRRLDRLALQTASEIDKCSYDVAFVQPCMYTQAPLVLRYLQTPTVYYCHEPPRELYELAPRADNNSRGWRTMLDRIDPLIPFYRATALELDLKATRAAQVVLVNSQFMRRTVARIYGIEALVCYHAVDTEIFRPLPQVERQGYILSVGSIQPRKGFDFLIESLGRLPSGNRPCLKIVGNAEVPGEREFLKTLATQWCVDLHIEVRVSQETLVRRYNEAMLLVYAPQNEPFGLAPLEAMACATPVVAVAEGGVPETVLDGVTGRLVERNHTQFAQAVSDLLSDRDRLSRYGHQARDRVLEHWTWDASVEHLENQLERITCIKKQTQDDRR